MGKALYRKYRSKKLTEIVGQEHVTTALSNALKKGSISHAYLFTGPRGVGKTSVARILAHEVNELPYDDSNHLDIIEIDAASNRRIDEIRSLRERVHNAPTSAKYKVYIIDEVHMLTKEAFNALLKTLEEPPEHVIFILATTEAHKLPETIISRTQRYTFKPAEHNSAVVHLKSIAKQENIIISDEALELVAQHGRGSFRDSISLLDQVSNSSKNISIDDVRGSLGIAPESSIQQLLTMIADGNASTVIEQLQTLHTQGFQAPQIAKQLSAAIRQLLLSGDTTVPSDMALRLLRRLIDVPAAHDPQALLELILLEPVLLPRSYAPVDKANRSSKHDMQPTPPQNQPISSSQKPVSKTKPTQKNSQESTTKNSEAEEKPQDGAGEPKLLDETSWQQILHALKQKHNTLYGVARMAVPIFDEGKLTLTFSFPFHQKRMNESKNKQKLKEIIVGELGRDVDITCIIDKSAPQRPNTPTKPEESATENAVDTISNIFGGAEVLE